MKKDLHVINVEEILCTINTDGNDLVLKDVRFKPEMFLQSQLPD